MDDGVRAGGNKLPPHRPGRTDHLRHRRDAECIDRNREQLVDAVALRIGGERCGRGANV